MLLATGTFPAVLISYWVMPEANLQLFQWRSTEWWWLTLYGLIAALFWHLTGRASPIAPD
jgi:hypothetical protein